MEDVKPSWRPRPLAALATVKSGFAFKSSQWKAAGIPVVKIGNVRDGSLDMARCSYVSDHDAVDSGFELQRDDLVIGLTGYVGQVAKVRNEGRLVLNQRVGKFYVQSGCDPDFLFALVANRSFRERVEAVAHGSAQPNVSPKAIEQLEIIAPHSIEEQRAIAAVLSALDDKIEINRRMNETLEASARALFRDWFVNFGPTRAKTEGRPAYLAPDLWSLFPDRLDDDGVPQGWENTPLAELAVELRRGVSPTYVAEGGICVLNQKCIRHSAVNVSLGRRHDSERKPVDRRLVQSGDVLVNSTGVGTLGRTAQIWDVADPMIVDSHVTVVRADTTKLSMYLLGQNLMLRESEIEALGEGSTGQTELSRVRLGMLDILRPAAEVQAAFDDAIRPLIDQRNANNRQSRTLAATRDALLPKLMSGEIRVRDAGALAA